LRSLEIFLTLNNQSREEIMQQTGAFIQNRNEGLARLRQEQVTEQEIKARAKQNKLNPL